MSSEKIVISAQNLSKCYPIYANPKDRLKQYLIPVFRRFIGSTEKKYFKEFWALKDVSFEIKRGDTVGIIGRNGAGKSTLLQILCGTLKPTDGEYTCNGRIAALLELGSGFNPEFSGRENVYLNASILGLRKEQIDERFESIAAFADIGDFIEQPVKTYSSGMYVRLAFAVIAHVDADILVVDEALAVGDAVFTQKCMRFIRAFQTRGTLFFVSHDTAAIQNLCKSAIWLDQGVVKKIGSAVDVSQAYLQYTLQEVYGNDISLDDLKNEKSISDGGINVPIIDRMVFQHDSENKITTNLTAARGWKTGAAEIASVKIESLSKAAFPGIYTGGESVRLTISARSSEYLDRPILGFLVRDRLGQDLFGENTLHFTSLRPVGINPGQNFSASFDFVLPMLPNGTYSVMASVADGDLYNNVQHHWLHDALLIEVSSSTVRWGLVGIQFKKVSFDVH